MGNAENLLDSISEDEIALLTADMDGEPHIIIEATRNITVPEELKRIAVQFDHDVETVIFDCPRYWDEHDLTKMKIYINYMRSDGYMDSYLAQKVSVDAADTSIIHFNWTISRNVTEVKGTLSFLVCAKAVDSNGNEKNHWNSELNQKMYVSEGLECEESVIISHSDIITQLLVRMDDVEAKTTEKAMLGYLNTYLTKDSEMLNVLDKFIYNYISNSDRIDDTIESYIKSMTIGTFLVIGAIKPSRSCLWFKTDSNVYVGNAELVLTNNLDGSEVFADVDDTTYGVENATVGKNATETKYNFDIL